jgi:hypothetical protein
VDLLFDDSETAYRRIVRQFCDDILKPIADEWGYRQSLRDARMLTIPDGTTEIHQLLIGRELTDISAFA